MTLAMAHYCLFDPLFEIFPLQVCSLKTAQDFFRALFIGLGRMSDHLEGATTLEQGIRFNMTPKRSVIQRLNRARKPMTADFRLDLYQKIRKSNKI